mmetsp:Transcript_13503/g.30675  ORF Transcript_13503/g.30675 Transcript_13503/m.30675 type:complete len:704 (+) Transcript_13503:62-2173(+)
MKGIAIVLVAITCWFPCRAAYVRATPISRVVELLKSLSDKLEQELKDEEDVYEKYVCWATAVTNAKTASNKQAESRIADLKTYIEDLDAGRVELTSERQDLTKELAALNAGLEEAAAIRAKEEADFSDADVELKQGITALQDAIKVLEAATQSSLLAVKDDTSSSPENLLRALQLTGRVLSKGDQQFMEAVLTGEVPDGPSYDWKKLNKEATFKQKYEARSTEIIKVLQNLLVTFKTSLADATSQEAAAKAAYDKLSAAKTKQRDATADALARLDKENGARGLTKAEAQAEIDALDTQVKDDGEYITQTKTALDAKKEEWKARKDLRMKEMKAMSEAVAILHNDDARDNFKKSFASQGLSLLQVSRLRSRMDAAARQIHVAATVMKDAAAASGDKRLSALAARVAASSGGHFDAVIEAIDKMVSALQKEESKDLKNKEGCEQDRATDTRNAALASRDIDEMSDTITRLMGEIADIEKEIEEKQAEIASIKEQMKEATRIREDEHKEWAKADAEDETAAATVQQAVDVLTAFYRENGLSLLSSSKQKREPVNVVAGEAPPPPPPTWQGTYAGATGESQGVIAILELLHADILKDQEAAKTAEDAAVAAYNNFMLSAQTDISLLDSTIGTLETTKAGKETELGQTKTQRNTKKDELDTVVKQIAAAYPGCAFVLVNHNVRVQNRQIEIDGLLRAKSILQGALSVS